MPLVGSAKRVGPTALCAGAAMLAAFAVTPASGAETRLSLSYSISLGGIDIGQAAVEATFVDNAYAAALRGSTRGVSRLITDATASMGARGNYRGAQVLPAAYEITMTEGGIDATGAIAFRNRTVTDLEVFPGLTPVWDRVPMTMAHVRDVVDPMSAMIVALGTGGAVSGEAACDRTLHILDGWQRFDVTLSYARTEMVADDDGYTGAVFVCAARYVPVAGHQPDYPPVRYLADSDRLEAWLMPVAGQPLMIPYQLMIGTEAGDLVIVLDRLSATTGG